MKETNYGMLQTALYYFWKAEKETKLRKMLVTKFRAHAPLQSVATQVNASVANVLSVG